MLKTIRLSHWEKTSLRTRRLLTSAKAFSMLSICSMLFFILIGIAGVAHQHYAKSPIYSMRQLAATVSGGIFGDMLEMEVPGFHSSLESETLNSKQISLFLMRALTDINLEDPRSVLASELPGMRDNEYFLMRKGSGTDASIGPQDYTPIAYDPSIPLEEETGKGEDVSSSKDNSGEAGAGKEEQGGKTATTNGAKKVFIYHSHNRESWYPELDEKVKDPNSKTKNITLVGKRLAEQLEEKGIGAMHSNMDYPTAIKDYRWELSYKYSMKTVKEAIASSKELVYFFDIHRDSQKRKYTTVDIDGKSYAQVYFIIGHKNPNWKKNEAFATQIHEALEKKYPGISRGIWGKTAANGNAEYNQSLADGNVLVEIGGVENTLEESYRTADALAEVISNIYWADEKVSGKE